MRLLVQSQSTGRYLVPDDLGTPVWVISLREAGGGVVFDPETAQQLIDDHCDFDDQPSIVDIDRLGTPNDYE